MSAWTKVGLEKATTREAKQNAGRRSTTCGSSSWTVSTRRAPEPTTATSSPPGPRTTRGSTWPGRSDPTPSRMRSGSTSTTTSARWGWSASGRPPPTRRRARSWRARCWPPRRSPFTSSRTPSPPGTWQAAGARRRERKGTHDYYSEFGLDTSAWNGTHFTLLGDAYMRPDDLTRTARVVAMSLGQLFDATRDGTPSADGSQRSHLHRRRRRDGLQLLHRHPPGDGHRDGEDRPGGPPGGGRDAHSWPGRERRPPAALPAGDRPLRRLLR